MDAKQFLILGISFVVLVLAVLFLASNMPKQKATATTAKLSAPSSGVQMETAYIEVVEGVENEAKVYFKNYGDDVKNFRVHPVKEGLLRCDAPACESRDPAYDFRTTTDTLSMDDVLTKGEEDYYKFYIRPYGFNDFTVKLVATYDENCHNITRTFSLPVKVTDGLVLETKQISYVPGATNTINLYFRNVGKNAIRNLRVTVEPVGTDAAIHYNQVYYSTFAGTCNLLGDCDVSGGDEKPVWFNMTSEKKPQKLVVHAKYAFLDEEREKTFEVNVV